MCRRLLLLRRREEIARLREVDVWGYLRVAMGDGGREGRWERKVGAKKTQAGRGFLNWPPAGSMIGRRSPIFAAEKSVTPMKR